MKKTLNDHKYKLLNHQINIMQRFLIFAKKKSIEIEVFIGVFILAQIIKEIPYINVIFTKNVISFFLILLAWYLFSISIKWILIMTLSLFGLAIFQQLGRNPSDAEHTSNLIYFLLWFVCILTARDIWKISTKH